MCRCWVSAGKFSHCSFTTLGADPFQAHAPSWQHTHPAEASATLQVKITTNPKKPNKTKSQKIPCTLHEILFFSSREALFNRLPAVFFMTASVYFTRLFSSNIQSLLQLSVLLLLSLTWHTLASQKQEKKKIRCWRTSGQLKSCVCTQSWQCMVKPSHPPHPCSIVHAVLHQCSNCVPMPAGTQLASSRLHMGSATPQATGGEQNPCRAHHLLWQARLAGCNAGISAATAAAILCLPSSMPFKGLLEAQKYTEITWMGSRTPDNRDFQKLWRIQRCQQVPCTLLLSSIFHVVPEFPFAVKS